MGTTWYGRAAARRGRTVIVAMLALAALLVGQTALAGSEPSGVEVTDSLDTTQSPQSVLGEPVGLTTDTHGSVYVTDVHHRIAEFDNGGRFVRQFGMGGSTTAGTNGHLYYPSDVAWFDGDVFVADTGGPDVQEFTDQGVFIRRWGTAGSGDGQFSYPQGIAADCEGHIYVTDGRNKNIQEFNKDGTFIRRFGTGKLDVPVGIAVASITSTECEDTDIFVADEYDGHIAHFSTAGTFIGNIGQMGTDRGQFRGPDEISLQRNAATGNLELWVAESGNNRVQQLVSNDHGATWQPGIVILSGYDQFNDPHGVTVGRLGQIWVDNMGSGKAYEFRQVPAALEVRFSKDIRGIAKQYKVMSIRVSYNHQDQSCSASLRLRITVPPNAAHVFTFGKNLNVSGYLGDRATFKFSNQQLSWMEAAWHEGRSVAALVHAVASCSDGGQPKATASRKF